MLSVNNIIELKRKYRRLLLALKTIRNDTTDEITVEYITKILKGIGELWEKLNLDYAPIKTRL